MTLPAEKTDAKIFQTGRRPIWSKSFSPYGHQLSLVLSAMIKEMRRGKEQEAMYWAHQMAISGAQAEKFMWEQLLIYTVEDVGPANPQLLSTVLASKEAYEQFEHGHVAKYMFVANAVSACALTKKSRHVENLFALMLYRLRQGEPGPEIPDYALDFHVKEGKKMGRGLKHYYDEASLLVNEDESFRVDDEGFAELRRRSEESK